jgi:hypothetical protein
MFLGWNINESDDECDLENVYDFLIKNKNLIYNIEDDCIIRAVYQNRREYTIQMDKSNENSSFVIEYMGEKTTIQNEECITVLEGHDVKISCIPNDVRPYKFVKWYDGYENPYRVLTVGGDDFFIYLKAYCEPNDNNDIKYVDNIDASTLNIFKTIYPEIKNSIFIDKYFIDNIYISNCEVYTLNNIPYIKIIENGYIKISNINNEGNFKLSLNNKGGDCKLFLDNYEILPSSIEKNEFIFEFNGGVIIITGEDSYIFSLSIRKECIYKKGKCMLCLNSDETLKLHPGDIVADGGIIVNGNPYGISQVKFAKVTNTTPLIIK